MAISNDGKIDELVREISALINGLASDGNSVESRFADQFNGLLDQLQSLVDRDLSTYRVSPEEFKSDIDAFEEMGVDRHSLGSLPEAFMKTRVDLNLLRTQGNRLISVFREQPQDVSAVFQHITISGTGHQTVVGVAGGDLSQSARHEVTPGNDSALISGLESLGIDEDAISDLKTRLEEETDPDGKKSAVRKWIRAFTSDVLAGSISGVIASQAPAALAMALGYLS